MEKKMKRVSTWGKVLGVIMMVMGALSALSGIAAMGVGAIPGAINVWLGYLLFQSGKEAEEYLRKQNQENKDKIVIAYSNYVFILGIMTVASILLTIPLFVIAVMMGLASP